MSEFDVVARYLQNADAVLEAAEAARVPLWLACAMIDKETDGRNVYGNDTAGVFSTPGAPDIEVTEANFREFEQRVLVDKERSNGVGPCQITWPGFLTEARAAGLRLWVPVDNMKFGFTLLRRYLSAALKAGQDIETAVKTVGTRYNGKATYGTSLLSVSKLWASRLGVEMTDVPYTPSMPLLSVGSVHPLVAWLTVEMAKRFRYWRSIELSSVFTPAVGDAVKEFQYRHNTTPGVVDKVRTDGVIDLPTWAALELYDVSPTKL